MHCQNFFRCLFSASCLTLCEFLPYSSSSLSLFHSIQFTNLLHNFCQGCVVSKFSVLANGKICHHNNMKNVFAIYRKRKFSIIPDVWIIFFQVCLSKFHSNSFHRDILSLSVLYSLCNFTHSGTLPEKAETQK